MKLAEALQLRADLNQRIDQLEARLDNNATMQEGEQPAEQPALLLRELDECLSQLETLATRINLTNAATVHEGQSLTAMLSARDVLRRKTSIYRSFLHRASQTASRATHSEIRILSTVSVPETQKQVDTMSAQLRSLDTAIQMLNFTTELL